MQRLSNYQCGIWRKFISGFIIYKGLLYKLAIFVVTVCVIVYFLPREGRFNYQFDINKPWKYGLVDCAKGFVPHENCKDINIECVNFKSK